MTRLTRNFALHGATTTLTLLPHLKRKGLQIDQFGEPFSGLNQGEILLNMKQNHYRNFSILIFVVGIVLALGGPALLKVFADVSWDVIFPPPDPRLVDPQLIEVRNKVTAHLARWPMWVGLFLIIAAIPNWIRASRRLPQSS